MESQAATIIVRMAQSQQQLARILEAHREVAQNMGRLVGAVPDDHDADLPYEAIMENAAMVTKSLSAYLNSLADLEEALANGLQLVMKELNPVHEGE